MGWNSSGVRASSAASATGVVDSGDLEHLPTPQLIAFLVSSFRQSEYDEVARILTSREESMAVELARRDAAKTTAESRCWSLETESSFLRARCAELEDKIKRGEGGLRAKVTELEWSLKEEKERFALLEAKHGELEIAKFFADEETEKYDRNTEQLQQQLECAEEDLTVLRAREQRAQEQIAGLLDELYRKERKANEKFIELKVENQDLKCGKRRAQDEADDWKRKYCEVEARSLHLIDEKLALEAKLDAVEKETGKIQSCGCSRTRVGEDCDSRHGRQHSVKPEAGSERKETARRHGFIEIMDSDDEMDAKAHRSADRGNGPDVMNFDRRNVDAVDDDDSSGKENYMATPASRRRYVPTMASSSSEGDKDDRVPIGKLKMKRLAEMIERSTEPKGHDEIVDSGNCSRKHFALLRQCEGVKDGAKEMPFAVSSARILTPAATYDVISRRRVDDVGHESQNASLDGFNVRRADGFKFHSNSDDAVKLGAASVSGLGNRLSKIRRLKGSKRWEYEAGMLSSLSKDPELCMEAVCAIYRRQRSLKKSAEGMLLANDRGFSTLDAYKASRMAEFLMDGDLHGPLKKSVEELENYDPQGLDYCCKLATHYSKQLFVIYQNKEDPYFSPS